MSLNEEIITILNKAIESRVFPGAVVAYSKKGESDILPMGGLTYEPESPAVTSQTVYDVASITKSIPTALLILKFVEEGRLSLDDRVITYLPELKNEYREHILIRHLLTYTAIPDLSERLSTIAKQEAAAVREILFKAPLKAPPGEKYCYTNAPAIFLGLIAERVGGKSLDVLAQTSIFEPLGMLRTTFFAERFSKQEVAPTEKDFRGEVWLAPHDETAWAFRREGHVTGHAGLFASAGDLLICMNMLLNAGSLNGVQYFQEETVAHMVQNQLAYLSEKVGLGWDLDQSYFMGEKATITTFGKTGFTGCAVMADTEREEALVLLCNHMYPERTEDKEVINKVRRDLATVLFSS